jgi:hypothetical protein
MAILAAEIRPLFHPDDHPDCNPTRQQELEAGQCVKKSVLHVERLW